MGRGILSLLVVLCISLSPLGQCADVVHGSSIVHPMSEFPVWSDPLDDMSHVYVPTGGLVGVAVAGGDVHLLPGSQTGWVASSVIMCPAELRYDLVLLEAYLPGKSHLNVTILDASKAPTESGFANATVPGYVNFTATDVSVFNLSQVAYPAIRIQVNLFASGADRPRLLAWSLMFIDLGMWQDEFLGTGKMSAHSGINVTNGLVEINMLAPAGPTYDPYPLIAGPESSAMLVSLFYHNATYTGYKDAVSLSGTEPMGACFDDFNGDGYLDLVVADHDTTSKIYWGNEDGIYSTSDFFALTTDFAWKVESGDLNGDGWPDLAFGGWDGAHNSQVFINGEGTFNSQADINFINQKSHIVKIGDLNGDGYDDIAFDNNIFYGGPNGPDTTADITIGGFYFCVRDVNLDEFSDFIACSGTRVNIYLGGASGLSTTPDYSLIATYTARFVDAGDVNGDGYIDIVVAGNDLISQRMYIFEGASDGWNSSRMYDDIHLMDVLNAKIKVGDVDTDGYADILCQDYFGGAYQLLIFKGGDSWPSTYSQHLDNAGLEDIAVAIPKDIPVKRVFSGSLITEPIKIPPGMKWDIVDLDVTIPRNSVISLSVLDRNGKAIGSMKDLETHNLDLNSIIANRYDTIKIKVILMSESNTTTPLIDRLLVNWVDKLAWREQFYGEAKFASALGFDINNDELDGPMDTTSRPDLLFASLQGDSGYDVQSIGFLADAGLTYTSLQPVRFNTTGASAIDSQDVDGDGILDCIFASYNNDQMDFEGSSPLFLGSPDGWYQRPYHSFPTTGAMGVAMRDLNGDGYADVVFAQERDPAGPMVNSTLFWGSATGWNATADVEFETTGASDVEVADVDGDGRLDLVFACYEDEGGYATDSIAFLQSAAGFDGDSPSYLLPTMGARAVESADLDKNGRIDLVFANSFNGITSSIPSSIYWGKAGGGFEATPSTLPTIGATDVKAADLDGDGDSDLVFANGRNATGGIRGVSYIYLNRGSGQFGNAPDVRLPTTGASAVAVADLDGVGKKDLVFATYTNETGFDAPSTIFLGSNVGWPSIPSFEVPTVGTMDVLPILLSDPARGGYLSQSIAPDTKDDIGAYDTLSYSATLAPGITGSIRIIDDLTGRTLLRSSLVTTGVSIDISASISYKEHPSVRVGVYAEGMSDPHGFIFDDLWLNWTQRIKREPVIISKGLTNTTCFRGHSVELFVNATDEYTAPGALDVRVEHRLKGGSDWSSEFVGARTFRDGLWRCVLTPNRFTPPGEYRVRINVTDSDGMFTGCQELLENLTVLPNLPDAPHTVTATSGDGEVIVRWFPPQNCGDVAVEAYQVWKGATVDALALVATVNAPIRTYRDTNVTNGAIYYYAVKALNYLGEGPLSQVVVATPMGLPGVPLGLQALAGDSEVVLTWRLPATDGGTPILGYRIYRGVALDALSWIADALVLTYTDKGLVNGVTLYYMVMAYNKVGDGPATIITDALPLGLCDAPGDLIAEPGNGQIALTWLAPLETGGSPMEQFVIYRGTSRDALERLWALGPTATSYTDTVVVAGTTYYYAIAAVTAAGEGHRSVIASATPYGPPGAPLGLVATAADGKVSLAWNAPASDGGSPIDGYVILRGLTSDALEELVMLADMREYTDRAVQNGLTYFYAVAALNGAGQGEASAIVNATPLRPTTVPGKVGNLIISVKDGKVVLQWTAPTSDGGSPLVGYVVMRGTSAGNMTLLSEIGVLLTFSDTTAKRGTTYYYTVVAKNAVGQGEPFAAVMVKVPKKPSDGPGFDAAVALAAVAAVAMLTLNSQRRRPRGA